VAGELGFGWHALVIFHNFSTADSSWKRVDVSTDGLLAGEDCQLDSVVQAQGWMERY